MANISAIKLPSGNTYDLKDNEALHGGQQFYLVKGTQTTTTAAWTGDIEVDALYDGLTIAYYLPRTSASNATLNLTLADGTTTGAINVYVTSTTRMGTHYGAGSTVLLTYWSAGSIEVNGTATTENRWTHGDYWNSNTIGEYAGSCTAGTNGMARYSLTLKVTESTWESLVTTSSTGTSKVKISSGFLLDSPIIYQSGGTYTSGNNAGQSSCWSTASFDTRYSINASNTWSVAGRSFYLVGTITNNKFYLKDTTWWADALPNAADGYYYWYVGQMYSAYQCTLYPVHPIYYYNNGIKIYAPVVAEDAKTVTGHTVAIDVPSNAKFTDTVTTVTTSGSGNAVTAITVTNGALTVTKGSTFLTSITSSQVTTALGYTPYNSTNPNGYTTNTGTVTKVIAGTGLSIGTTAGGNFTTSGTINHTNSVTAQTTQAVYPIKIDAQGHISAYGSAVTIPDVSGKIDTAGTGLSKSGTTLNHSNSITAQTTQAIYPIKIDAQGHISAYGSAVTPLTSHQTIKQDGVTGATGNHYGACSTAAGTAAKTVSITAGTPTLEAGLRVTVKFANANTAGTPTLNVNSLGAKNIFHNGAQITTGTNKALLAGTVEFVYDGTQWQLVGNYVDTDTKAWGSITGKPTATGSNTTGITASTTANKTTLGTASSIYGVQSTTTTASKASGSNGSASTWAFTGVTVANSIAGAVDSNDNTQLNITVGTTTVQSKSSGGNGTAPTWSFTDVTVPIKNSSTTSVPSVSVASATVSITDPGHIHSIS